VVKGAKPDAEDRQFLHVGIANRGFERRFELADFVRVEAADLADGLLTIDLVREVPEAMKPKKVLIGEQKPLKVIEGDASAAA
jgi:molecular chaperone IbpA